MKKQKPTASMVILIALFILAQATFALSNTLPLRATQDENTEILSVTDNNETPAADNDEALAANDNDTHADPQELKDLAATTIIPVISYSAMASAPKTSTATIAQVTSNSETSETAQTDSVPQKEIKPVVRYVNANELNVRESPSSESQLITTIRRGDKVTYYETEGEWARIITWTDKKGYILAKYLVDSEKEVQKVETKTASTNSKKTNTSTSRSSSSTTASSQPPSAEALSLTEQIIEYAKSLQGVKYVHGGYSTSGLDCSGFTKYVFAKFGITVPRSSSAYYSVGTKVSRSDLRAGDILLFDGWGNSTLNHVGIYIGGGYFIHASTTKGKVVIQELNSYRGTYLGARRVIN